MGYDISQETYEKIERNRREGRDCRGPSNRAGCSTPAVVKIVKDVWTHRIGGQGAGRTEMPMCRRHARQFPVGSAGVNFRVIEHQAI